MSEISSLIPIFLDPAILEVSRNITPRHFNHRCMDEDDYYTIEELFEMINKKLAKREVEDV